MSFVKSDNIQVFPTSLRGYNESDASYSRGKYTSEENLTGIVKTLANKPSFIINWDTVNGCGELVINGYYFNITGTNSNILSGPLYAYIYLDSSHRLTEQNGFGGDLDKSGDFNGITFGNTVPLDVEENNSLQILDNNGEVIEGNFYKFDAKTVYTILGSGGIEINLESILQELFNSGIISPTGEVGIVPTENGGTGLNLKGNSNMVPVSNGTSTATAVKATSNLEGNTIVRRDATNHFSGIVSNAERLNENVGVPVEMGSDSIGYIPIVHFGTDDGVDGTPLVKNNIYYSYDEEFPEGLTPEDGDIFITLFNGSEG